MIFLAFGGIWLHQNFLLRLTDLFFFQSYILLDSTIYSNGLSLVLTWAEFLIETTRPFLSGTVMPQKLRLRDFITYISWKNSIPGSTLQIFSPWKLQGLGITGSLQGKPALSMEKGCKNPKETLCMLWINPVIFTDCGKPCDKYRISPQSVNITGFIHNINRVSLWFLQPFDIESADFPCK